VLARREDEDRGRPGEDEEDPDRARERYEARGARLGRWYDFEMRVLIIGGIQFMGREAARRLAARGDEVTVLHRREGHDLGPAVRELRADRADLPRVERLLREQAFDAIVDTAYDWVNGTPPGHVEAAARAAGPQLTRYVFVSSIAAYGGGLDRDEDDPLAPDDVPNPYARHKAAAERALFRSTPRTASRRSRSARPSSTGRGSPSTARRSSGTGCATAAPSSSPTAARR